MAGFLVGAGGLVAAQIDDSPAAEVGTETSSTTADTMPDTTAAGSDDPMPTWIDLTVPTVTFDDSTGSSLPRATIDDSTSSSLPTTVPTITIDDGNDDSTSSSLPTTVPTITIDDGNDDSTSSSLPTTVPTTTIDDGDEADGNDDSTSSSLPTTTIDGNDDSTSSSLPTTSLDDSSTSTVPASLPAPFGRSYQSAGGSIDVTWTGTALVLHAVSPAPGFVAEIEDQSWDRIRVDFEGGSDARIEVRLTDGQIRVRVD